MRVIDLRHLGRARVIGCWQVGDVLIDPGPSSCLPTLLEALGDERPSAVLLTHIHFDHAGVCGTLVERWPDLPVYVHERGARHMASPERLYASVKRLYGEDMERLWGEMKPVPGANLRVVTGGETVLEDFAVAYTPGHASHHVSYLHEGTAFVGDVAGVRVTPDGLTVPPTPPPDIDVEAWHASIELVRAWGPDRLAMTHFGDSSDVDRQLDELAARLDDWAQVARHGDAQGFAEYVRDEIRRDGSAEQIATYEQASPVDQMYAGLERYWSKKTAAESAV